MVKNTADESLKIKTKRPTGRPVYKPRKEETKMKTTTKTELKEQALNIASALCNRYPLYHCNASVLTHRRCERFILLQSYRTITGIADLKTRNIYIFDYYSATSIQHAYKFKKYLQEKYHEYFNVVKLWSRSQLTASEKRKLEQEDYSSLIQLS